MRLSKFVAVAAVLSLATSQSAFAVPQVAPDNLWDGNLMWNCVALASQAPDKSAARADLHRIVGAALASEVTHQTGDFDPALKGQSEEFWRGANFGAAINFVVSDLFARLPDGSGPSFLSEEAARLYDQHGCASLGR